MTALPIPNSLAPHRETVRQVASFGVIGVVSTAACVALYAVLREAATPAAAANAIALIVTAVGNTGANRWLTFHVRGRASLARDQAVGLVALGVALAITSASLVILSALAPHHGRPAEVVVLIVANAAATLVRFLLLRLVLGRPRTAAAPAQATLATLTQSERTRG
jgi:putative flippase GtrA